MKTYFIMTSQNDGRKVIIDKVKIISHNYKIKK